MNKILKSLLSVAIMSASFASCSQVDLISDLEAEKKATTVTLNMHSDWQGTPIVFATNTVGNWNEVFYASVNGENKRTVPFGEYKFYVVNRDEADFDYENLDLKKLPVDSLYYGNVRIAHKMEKITDITDEGVRKVLSDEYVRLRGGVLRGDSTMLVETKIGENVNVTTEKPYLLTTDYLVTGSITATDYIDKIYVEICDVIAKKRPNGSVVGGKKVKALLTYSGVKKGGQKVLDKSMIVLGVANSGTANVYVRFLNADKTQAPEMKTVRYTVVNGKDDKGVNRRIIKLGDFTF